MPTGSYPKRYQRMLKDIWHNINEMRGLFIVLALFFGIVVGLYYILNDVLPIFFNPETVVSILTVLYWISIILIIGADVLFLVVYKMLDDLSQMGEIFNEEFKGGLVIG